MLKLLGIPYDKNSSFMQGPALAPNMIRQMETDGSANRFSELGLEIVEGSNYTDLGDLDIAHCAPQEAYDVIKRRVSEEIQQQTKLICFGGDHSVSYPIIEAHANTYSGLNILHLDAHSDLYDNFDDNPFSHASPFARLMETGLINSLTQVGIRCLTTHQKEQAKTFDVEIIEMKDFTTDFLNHLDTPLYLSLDIDVLDPAFAPGISHHEPGGMTTRQLFHVIQNIEVPIIGADIVELNPKRDLNNVTAMVAYKSFKEIATKMITV